jgi:hypothetical protein
VLENVLKKQILLVVPRTRTRQKKQRLGRPPEPRLARAERAAINAAIDRRYGLKERFFEAVFARSGDPKHGAYTRPNDVGTVKRAYLRALSGQSPLPHRYELLAEELLAVSLGHGPRPTRSAPRRRELFRVIDGSDLPPDYRDVGFFDIDRTVFPEEFSKLTTGDFGSQL